MTVHSDGVLLRVQVPEDVETKAEQLAELGRSHVTLYLGYQRVELLVNVVTLLLLVIIGAQGLNLRLDNRWPIALQLVVFATVEIHLCNRVPSQEELDCHLTLSNISQLFAK